ncbi:MAG: adenylate/guanylate cyclase domain-containing protein [Bacteroidota bacterium]
MTTHKFLFLALCLLLTGGLSAQSISGDPQADIRSLRGLPNAEYLRTAVDYAVAYSKEGNGTAANKLLNNALLKARVSGGRNAAARVHLAYVEGLVECCLTGAYAEAAQLRIMNSLTKAHNLDRNRVLTGDIKNHLRQVNAQATAPNVLAAVARLARTIDPSGQLGEELQGSTQMAVEQQNLLDQSAELQDEVRAQEQEIQNLSLAAARERALAEYHRKVADSLHFIGLIDSLTVIQQEQALTEQAATIQLQDSELELRDARSRMMVIIIVSALLGLALVSIFYLRSRQLNRRLATEKARSEELLLNILPKDVAEELKTTGQVEPRFYELGTVLFTDFVDFSSIAQALPSDRLIKDLDECFQLFDHLAGEYGVEKIKTIGDAYMCIGGVPTPDTTAVRNMIGFALELQSKLAEWNAGRVKDGLPLFQARIGIHTGPVVAGVVGVKKFSYDVWGDTVNVAARMESQSAAGKVNVSAATYKLVQNDFTFTARGAVDLKNMAPMDMYFVEGANVSLIDS